MSSKSVFTFVLITLCTTTTVFIISNQWIEQIRPLDRLRQLTTPIYRNGSSTSNISCDSKSALSSKSRSKYLWCVTHAGPNNQLKDFIKCVIIALTNNYTVILPPLFPHYLDKMKGIQWFDHFYDLKRLRFVVNFISLDSFIKPMISTGMNVTIDCYLQQIERVKDQKQYAANALDSVQAYYQRSIHFRRYVNLSSTLDMKELSKKMQNCWTVFSHIHYKSLTQFFQSPNKYTALMFTHLTRSALIQRMAKQTIHLLPQLLIGSTPETNLTTLAVAHLRRGDRFVMSVSNYMRQISHLITTGVGFTHVYIMCPDLTASDVAEITRGISIPITTTEKLLNHGHFFMDEYLFDVLEQEIAFQAPIFLASPSSTYSTTVIMQRLYQNKGPVYLFSTKGDNRPVLVTKENAQYPK